MKFFFQTNCKTGFSKEEKTEQCTEISRYSEVLKSHAFMDKRAEELSVDFINFTKEWKSCKKLIKIFLKIF